MNLTDRCPECAFDPSACGPAELPAAVEALGRRYRAPLTRFLPGEDDAVVRARPLPGAWSALAYACQVRDVLVVFDEGIRRMLTEDDPALDGWDPEAAAEKGGYDAADPADVADALAANAASLAATLSSVGEDGWGRTGALGDEAFTVLGAGRSALHEGSHRLLDIGRVLRAARGR